MIVSTLKLLACLLYPDAGGGRVNGFDLRRQRMDVRGSVSLAKAGGWLGTLWQLNGIENLMFRSQLCGIPRGEGSDGPTNLFDRHQPLLFIGFAALASCLLFIVELETHNVIAVDGRQPCALLEFSRYIVF